MKLHGFLRQWLQLADAARWNAETLRSHRAHAHARHLAHPNRQLDFPWPSTWDGYSACAARGCIGFERALTLPFYFGWGAGGVGVATALVAALSTALPRLVAVDVSKAAAPLVRGLNGLALVKAAAAARVSFIFEASAFSCCSNPVVSLRKVP